MLLRHISTFNLQSKPGDDSPSLDNVPTPTPTIDPTPPISTTCSPSPEVAEHSAYASSPTTSVPALDPSDNSETLSFPDDGENHGLWIDRTWVDTHASLLHTDHGLYVSVRGIKDADEPDGKRPREEVMQSTRSKVAKTDLQVDAATASHTKSELYET
jgi:hypothetical protein